MVAPRSDKDGDIRQWPIPHTTGHRWQRDGVAARDRWMEAAIQGTWGCRLSFARIKTPVHPPAIDQFQPMGHPNSVWLYDWYAHVLFASQLFEAVRALVPVIDASDLRGAFAAFEAHWAHLGGVRNVLMHPTSRDVNVSWLRASADWIEYREQNHDPYWRFSADEFHDPVEQLYVVVEQHRTD